MLPPTQDELLKAFSYDPGTGVLTRREGPWRRQIGKPAGTTHPSSGYVVIGFNGRKYPAHRLIWRMVTGEWRDAAPLDHINGARNDNRWVNLRPATAAQNAVNWKRKRRKHMLPRGVAKRRNKFAAYIATNPGMRYLGLFNTPEEAHSAYLKAARERHGRFVPDQDPGLGA